MLQKDDWRLRGQEEYLTGRSFRHARFAPQPGGSDHAHCEFCWHKFMQHPEGVPHCSARGWLTLDGAYWVCEECFADLKEAFGWTAQL